MSDPRFQACSWCADGPEVFGRLLEPRWNTVSAVTDDQGDQLRVAQAHHDVILQVRAALRLKRWTVARYAAEVGYTRDRMGKLMRGTAVLRLEDLAAMERIFKLTLLPRPMQGGRELEVLTG